MYLAVMAADVFYSAALRRVMHIAYVWPCCMPLPTVNAKEKVCFI